MFHVKQAEPDLRIQYLWEELRPSPGLAGWEQVSSDLSSYTELLLRAAEQRSLLSTSQRNESAIWEHILDSLQILRLLEATEPGCRVLDIGSGNGLPGIPLAISLPNTEVRLLERKETRLEFLEFAIGCLELRNTATIKGELESSAVDLTDFECITVRAVGPVPVFKALSRIHTSDRHPSCFAYATEASSVDWIKQAEESGYLLSARFALKLPEKSLARSYLKFTPQ